MEQRHTFPETAGITDLRNILPKNQTVWEILRHTARPIVLYGTGNGGDKLIDALARIGRTPDGVFASNGFVRNRTFHNMPVLSLADAERQFGRDMIVLCAFGSSVPEVMDHMRWLDENYTFYMPELPLYSGDLFDHEYFITRIDEINQAYSFFADERSKTLFRDILLYRLSGKIGYLEDTEPFNVSLSTLLATDKIHTALDGGAYNGDTAKEMRAVFPNLKELIAAEPDARTFKKLSAYAEESDGVVRPVNCALTAVDGTYTFSSSGCRGSGIAGKNMRAKTVKIQTHTVDTLCQGKRMDFIKLDIEGAEAEALTVAADTARRFSPALAVSLYHRSEDIFALPLQVSRLCDRNYKYYLRRVPCFPAWDLMLYAVPEKLEA